MHIAQAIYDERRFQDLPILADVLEEAGCTDRAIHRWSPLSLSQEKKIGKRRGRSEGFRDGLWWPVY